MKKLVKKLFVLLTCAMLLATTACSSSDKDTTASTTAGTTDTTAVDTMNIIMTTAPVGMHPLKTNDAPSSSIGSQIFETLYIRTMDGTSYEPLLAADMPQFSEDGLTATIPLRENVTFQDGTPFTADDVAYMIDCLKDETYGSLRPSIVESIESYEIIDDHTIQLNLLYEDGVLVAKLAHTNGAIVNPELDQSQDLLIDPTGAGTGPYKFVSAVTGSSYDLTANEDYWGGAPEVKNIHFDVIADESTAIARLQTGEADLFTSVTADNFNTVSNIPGYTAVNETSSSIYYLALRSTADTALNPLMENVEFRTAILQAINIPLFVDSMLDGKGSYSASIVGPTLVGYTEAMEEAGIAYDAEAAQKAIDENGWAGETVTILSSTNAWQQDIAIYIQAELQKVGINVDIISEEWASYLTSAKEDKKFDITLLSWSNVTGDGQQMLEPNFSTKNGLRVKYNNAEFDAFVDASAKTTDLAEREAAMLEAVKMIQQDAVTAPLYSANQLFVYNSDKFANVSLDKGGLYRCNLFTVVK